MSHRHILFNCDCVECVACFFFQKVALDKRFAHSDGTNGSMTFIGLHWEYIFPHCSSVGLSVDSMRSFMTKVVVY